MPYKVKLEAFEGPLDLLLFLIKKNEVDIYDIPIAVITKQYLEYIEIIQLFDIEAASDFILMAASLMRIKAQMLLPLPEIEEEMDEVEDPRQELVYRLLEYKRFKDAAVELATIEGQERQYYRRGKIKIESSDYIEPIEYEEEVSLFDLISAFKKIAERKPKVTVHHVEEINVHLEEQIEHILQEIEKHTVIEFSSLFKDEDDKLVWIVTFIGILELIKQRQIRAVQEENFAEIILSAYEPLEEEMQLETNDTAG